MPRPATGQLERSIEALTIGVHQAAARRRVGLADTHTGEREQQVQVQVSGVAGSDWGFVDRTVSWMLPFVYAPMQRTVPFKTPHFTAGIELVSSPDLIVIHAQVLRWTVTEEGWFVGATVRFPASAPLAASPVAFSAIAHLRFHGFAALADTGELDQ